MAILSLLRRIVPEAAKTPVHRLRWEARLYQTLRHFSDSRAEALRRYTALLVRPQKRVLFHPQMPGYKQVVYKACVLNGYRPTRNRSAPFDFAFKYWDVTAHDPLDFAFALRRGPVLNADSTDISKARVQRLFRDVFGYDLGVDPTVYQGAVLKKSNDNCAHDGEIVRCPLSPEALEPGFVYEKVIDIQTSDGHFKDHRVPVYGGQIPLVYLKYRPPHDRYKSVSHSEIKRPSEVFSAGEIEKILQFASQMGVDFAELDVLRDNGDGRIYIVDVNNTPSGPLAGVTASQQRQALSILAPAFAQMVNGRIERHRAWSAP